MIEIIFNPIPKASAIPWNIIIPVLCVILGSFLGFWLTIIKEHHDKKEAEKKEKEEFLEIKRSMPDIIELIKNGLNKNRFKFKLSFFRNGKIVDHEIREDIYYTLSFDGESEIEIPEKKCDDYHNRFKYLNHIGFILISEDRGCRNMTLSRNFIEQIKKWG